MSETCNNPGDISSVVPRLLRLVNWKTCSALRSAAGRVSDGMGWDGVRPGNRSGTGQRHKRKQG